MSNFQTSLYDISKTSILIEPFYDFEQKKDIKNSSVHNQQRQPFQTNQWLSCHPKTSSVLQRLGDPTLENSLIVDFELPKGATMLSKTHLHITVPQIVKTDGTFANICNKGGLALIESIQLIYRQGQIILEDLDLNLIDIIEELNIQNYKDETLFIGQIDTSIDLISDSTGPTQYYIKIPTWFETKKFPLFLYNSDELVIRLRMKPISQIVIFDGNFQPTWDNTVLSVKLYCQMILFDLDTSILKTNYILWIRYQENFN